MKRIFTILTVIMFVITFYFIKQTFALLQSEANGEVNNEVGAWKININGTNINQNNEFTINNLIYSNSNGTTVPGKIAPGLSGHFDIVVDPTDTDVSVMYNINFDFSKLDKEQLHVDSVTELSSGNLIRTDESTYTGVIPLQDVKQGIKHTVRVIVKWDNIEEKNKEDSEIGTVYNQKLNIPVIVNTKQYLGEQIGVYEGE